MNEPKHLFAAQNRLGETPIWSPEKNILYWVNWGGLPSCSYEPATGNFTKYPVNLPVTALARRASGGMIAVAQGGVYAWDPITNAFSVISGPPDLENLDICFNDCAVDRQGRLLLSTVNMKDPFLPDGSLFRLDPDGSLHELDGGYATANGIGVSPDGKSVYVADQRHRQIIALDYNIISGETCNRRIFARLTEEDGMPDGLIVDAEGYIWNGHWGGWKLTRYAPDGGIERQIRFPVEHVISCAFGGINLDELYVTTSSWGFGDEERKKQPWGGDLFTIMTGVKGMLEPAFIG